MAALWLAFHEKRRLVAFAKSRNAELQEVFREALRDTARTPIGWDTSLYGDGVVDALRLLVSPAVAIGIRTLTRRARPDSGDYVSSAVEAVKQLLREVSSGLARDSTDAFDNELARIFLDEANETDTVEHSLTREYLLDVVRRRGSRTLRAAIGQ